MRKIIFLLVLFACCSSFIPIPVSVAYPCSFPKDNSLQYLRGVLDFGKSRGWSTIIQDQRFNNSIARFSANSITAVAGIIRTANTNSAQVFALKSLLDGDDYPEIQRFIGELNQYNEAYQQQHCLVFNPRGLVQKWQYSCSIAVVLTYLAELNPRYAWDMKKVSGYDQMINDPNNAMAIQEKMLLEKYGGRASARGDASGKQIGLLEPIDDLVGNILGVRFNFQQINGSRADALESIREILNTGMNVPALINFLPGDASHFVLFMRDKYEQGQYWYMIYEPWEGKCAYVSSSAILSDSMSPLLSQWSVRLTYYYTSAPK